MLLVNDLTQLLQEVDPLRAHVYARNRREIMQRLSRIDREYEYGYRGLKAGLGVQYHDTLQYFEQAYALTILDRVVEVPTQPGNALSLLRVRQRITDGEADCLLTERGLSPEHLNLLTEGQEINVGELDALGSQWSPGPDLYFDLMQHTTDTIKRCLNADMDAARMARRLTDNAVTHGVDGIGGGRFLLTDHLGRLVTEESMRGKYQLLYFGYTYCPDICPNTLQVLSMALDLLGDKADQVQTYFITVDPERDTVKVMRNYVDYFDPRMIGVTGSKAMIDSMAEQFKIRYEKVIEENSDPDLYLLDHSASLYLLAPDGRFVTEFVYGVSAEKLAQKLDLIIP
jgi:protein SCO1/2